MRYEDVPGVNISTLKELWSKSPLHYRYRLEHPREETPALTLGIATHMAILEPLRFAEHYMVRPEGLDGRTAAGKAWLAQYGHLPILTFENHQACLAMRAAVESHPVASRYLGPGQVERIIQWTDPEMDIACKGRVDMVLDSGVLVDLKTARDVNPRMFATQAARLGYHLQLAFYHDGLEALGKAPPAVVIIAVESAAPHDVVVYEVPTDVLGRGREEYRLALETLKMCRVRNEWPGYGETATDLVLPTWALGEDIDDVADYRNGGEG